MRCSFDNDRKVVQRTMPPPDGDLARSRGLRKSRIRRCYFCRLENIGRVKFAGDGDFSCSRPFRRGLPAESSAACFPRFGASTSTAPAPAPRGTRVHPVRGTTGRLAARSIMPDRSTRYRRPFPLASGLRPRHRLRAGQRPRCRRSVARGEDPLAARARAIWARTAAEFHRHASGGARRHSRRREIPQRRPGARGSESARNA